MEFPPSPPAAAPLSFWRRSEARWAVLGLMLYAAFLGYYVHACAGGSDSSGYLNHARLLAAGRVHLQPRSIAGLPAKKISDFVYSPLGLKPAPDGDGLVPTYPAGLPLLILAARFIVGWAHAFDLVMLVHALAGVLLTFALGRILGLSWKWSALGAALLAASPLYLDLSLQGMSDVPALVWVTAAAIAVWRARERPAWALAAGAALSIAVLVRPNNVLMAAPLFVAWCPVRFTTGDLRRLLSQAGLLALGAAPGAVFFCLHSAAAYGRMLTTGYGDTSPLFDRHFVAETLLHYIHWLPAIFTPFIGLFLLLPWAGRRAARPAIFLAAWGLPYLGFYACYYFTHETWWYLRFLLPAAPALLIGAMQMGSRVAVSEWARPLRLASGRTAPFLVLAGLLIAEEGYWDRKFSVLHSGRSEAAYLQAAQWLQAHAPPDAILSVMQTSGAMLYDTDFTLVRWDQFDARTFPLLVAAAAAAHRPIYAPLYDFETADFMRRSPGRWEIVGKTPLVTIWRWAGAAAAP